MTKTQLKKELIKSGIFASYIDSYFKSYSIKYPEFLINDINLSVDNASSIKQHLTIKQRKLKQLLDGIYIFEYFVKFGDNINKSKDFKIIDKFFGITTGSEIDINPNDYDEYQRKSYKIIQSISDELKCKNVFDPHYGHLNDLIINKILKILQKQWRTQDTIQIGDFLKILILQKKYSQKLLELLTMYNESHPLNMDFIKVLKGRYTDINDDTKKKQFLKELKKFFSHLNESELSRLGLRTYDIGNREIVFEYPRNNTTICRKLLIDKQWVTLYDEITSHDSNIDIFATPKKNNQKNWITFNIKDNKRRPNTFFTKHDQSKHLKRNIRIGENTSINPLLNFGYNGNFWELYNVNGTQRSKKINSIPNANSFLQIIDIVPAYVDIKSRFLYQEQQRTLNKKTKKQQNIEESKVSLERYLNAISEKLFLLQNEFDSINKAFTKNINNNFPNEDMEAFDQDEENDLELYYTNVVDNIPEEKDFELNKELLLKSKNLLYKTDQFIELHKFNGEDIHIPNITDYILNPHIKIIGDNTKELEFYDRYHEYNNFKLKTSYKKLDISYITKEISINISSATNLRNSILELNPDIERHTDYDVYQETGTILTTEDYNSYYKATKTGHPILAKLQERIKELENVNEDLSLKLNKRRNKGIYFIDSLHSLKKLTFGQLESLSNKITPTDIEDYLINLEADAKSDKEKQSHYDGVKNFIENYDLINWLRENKHHVDSLWKYSKRALRAMKEGFIPLQDKVNLIETFSDYIEYMRELSFDSNKVKLFLSKNKQDSNREYKKIKFINKSSKTNIQTYINRKFFEDHVLINLYENSMKYAFDDKDIDKLEITIEFNIVNTEDLSAYVESLSGLDTNKYKKYIHITYTDNGKGIEHDKFDEKLTRTSGGIHDIIGMIKTHLGKCVISKCNMFKAELFLPLIKKKTDGKMEKTI